MNDSASRAAHKQERFGFPVALYREEAAGGTLNGQTSVWTDLLRIPQPVESIKVTEVNRRATRSGVSLGRLKGRKRERTGKQGASEALAHQKDT